MLKKWTALFLCALLVLLCPLAGADISVSQKDQLDKLTAQWKTSGFRGTLTGSVSGVAPAFMDAQTWEALAKALPSMSLSLTHTVMRGNMTNGEEAVVTLNDTSSGEAVETARAIIVRDSDGVTYIHSPLLDDGGLYYAFSSQYDWLALLNDASGDNAWPSLTHVLYELERATADWKTRAQPYYDKFALSLTKWLQNYIETSTEKNDQDRFITTNFYEVPAAAVLQEAKQLLVDLYADQELLALLREVLTMEEQAAYLQPTMLLSFLSMLDKVQLSGNVTVRRQFDSATGAFLHESVYLPFAEGFPVSEVTLVHLPQETGDGYQVSGALKAGLTPWSAGSITFDVTAVSGGEGIWSGDVRVTIPGSTDAELLEPIPDQAFAFSYNLDIPEPVVNNDVYGGRFEKTYAATLLIRPEEGSGLSPLSVKAGAVIYSKSSSVGSVTYLESTLDVTDMDTSSVLHLSFDGKTATGWTPLYLAEAPANALRVDLLDANGRTEILNALLTKLTGAAQ